jgi:hypothetical protein
VDKAFVIEQRDAFQRRLDRALGYLDRSLDEDDRHSAPSTHTVPAPAPAVGPNFDDIGIPQRRRSDGEGYYAAARLSEPFSPTARRRRY